MRKSITSQTEKALVSYLQSIQSTNSLAPVTVYAGGLFDVPASIEPPWLILTAQNPEQLNPDCGIYELSLMVCLATQVDDEMQVVGQDIHRARLEDLRDLLEDVTTLKEFTNAPYFEQDTRTVQNFTLSGLVYEQELTKMEDRKLVTDLTYYVVAAPSDS